MEDHWIESLKTKLVDMDTSKLKQLLLSNTETVGEIKRSQNQEISDNETKIKELMTKFAAMKETLYTETQTSEHNNKKLLKEKGYLEELEMEKKKLLQEIRQLEAERNNLKSTKPNLQDQQLLEQGKKKLSLYKDLTKIQWDYQATIYGIKGYVSNRRDYIHHFCYENQESDEKLIDSLWHEIHLSTVEAENKDENLPRN